MRKITERLQEKRRFLSDKAKEHRQKRNDLNKNTRIKAKERDHYNSLVRENLSRSRDLKKMRDDLNVKVFESKKLRNQYNKEARELHLKIVELQAKLRPKMGRSMGALRNEVKELEMKQQTEAMDSKKERELIDKIKELMEKIRKREREFEENEKTREVILRKKEVHQNAEDEHQKVNEYAQKAQQYHEEMIESKKNIRKYRKLGDEKQQEFVEYKTKADVEHRAHTQYIIHIRDLDKILGKLIRKKKKASEKIKKKKDKGLAENIFQQFKEGGKLSTEDLLQVQKARKM